MVCVLPFGNDYHYLWFVCFFLPLYLVVAGGLCCVLVNRVTCCCLRHVAVHPWTYCHTRYSGTCILWLQVLRRVVW